MMDIWNTVQGWLGGGSTPGINPGAGQPPKMGGQEPMNVLEEIQPVARGQAEARGHGSLLTPEEETEPTLEPVEVNYGEHSLIAPTLTKAALDQKKAPFAFDPSALSGLSMGGGAPAPGGRVGAGVGNMGILDYYNRNQPFQQVIQQSLLGPSLDNITGRR